MFLKNVATRSNDQTYLLPNLEPMNDAYDAWKAKNYNTELLALARDRIGYRHAYAHHNMYLYFKILKAAGLLGAVNMANSVSNDAYLRVDGEIVYINGEPILIDEDGFEV